MATKKQLFKSSSNTKVFGVFGGLGEYFNIDPTLLRLLWILVVVFSGFFPGVIAYLIAAAVMPNKI